MARFIEVQKDLINVEQVRRVTKQPDEVLTVYFADGSTVNIQGPCVPALWWYLQQFCFDYEAQYATYLHTSEETGVG